MPLLTGTCSSPVLSLDCSEAPGAIYLVLFGHFLALLCSLEITFLFKIAPKRNTAVFYEFLLWVGKEWDGLGSRLRQFVKHKEKAYKQKDSEGLEQGLGQI